MPHFMTTFVFLSARIIIHHDLKVRFLQYEKEEKRQRLVFLTRRNNRKFHASLIILHHLAAGGGFGATTKTSAFCSLHHDVAPFYWLLLFAFVAIF